MSGIALVYRFDQGADLVAERDYSFGADAVALLPVKLPTLIAGSPLCARNGPKCHWVRGGAKLKNLAGIGLVHLAKRQTIRTGEYGPVLQHVELPGSDRRASLQRRMIAATKLGAAIPDGLAVNGPDAIVRHPGLAHVGRRSLCDDSFLARPACGTLAPRRERRVGRRHAAAADHIVVVDLQRLAAAFGFLALCAPAAGRTRQSAIAAGCRMRLWGAVRVGRSAVGGGRGRKAKHCRSSAGQDGVPKHRRSSSPIA